MQNKDIVLQRIFDNGESTIGYMVYGDKHLTFNIEDTFNATKVKSQTRIPAGRYKLSLKTDMTELTKKYKSKYTWFKWHIEVTKVPNYSNVYIHIGNWASNTEGCILCGKTANNNTYGTGMINESTTAFKEFYEWIFPKLHSGMEIYIQIRDEIGRDFGDKNQTKMSYPINIVT